MSTKQCYFVAIKKWKGRQRDNIIKILSCDSCQTIKYNMKFIFVFYCSFETDQSLWCGMIF